MSPIPCAHCGRQYMQSTDSNLLKLCNNCALREEKKNPKGSQKMETVTILIQCPKDLQKKIEGVCIERGVNFTQYFIDLHEKSVSGPDFLFVKEGTLPKENITEMVEVKRHPGRPRKES